MSDSKIVHFQPRPKPEEKPKAATPARRAFVLAAKLFAIAEDLPEPQRSKARNLAHEAEALSYNIAAQPTGPKDGGVA
ncbi:hypothetical protein [Azospirillum canadense]|uniref:hypothetical protein n=1 Tax=Azospirillum canadense TaxID=403962 RepID=UPI002227FA31|nr:hypothetical protein [Azospirillum canadense]MCW2242202.1 hypothetical protein [Azospirillum canadense]